MSATEPHVGVRVFSNLTQQVASIDARDSTVVGLALPCPNMALADQLVFEEHKPMRIPLDDPETIARLGPGMARDTIEMLARGGIVTDVAFVRVPHVEPVGGEADIEDQIGAIVGSASAKEGVFALLEAKAELGIEPGLLICPGYTEQRLGDAANPVAVALDTISQQIIDALVIVDTPDTSREAAAEYAADFSTSLNVLAMYPKAKITLDGAQVTRPLSALVAAHVIRSDKANGHPYKAFWNRQLVGLEGLSQRVSYRDGDTTSDANFLNFHGVGTVIENKILWSPFNTATDPTAEGYRSIKRVRTRRSIEKAIPRALRLYNAQDLGPHLVTLISTALYEAIEERENLGALVKGGSRVEWRRGENPNTLLRDGGLRVHLAFEETPELIDLQVFSEPNPPAFDILWNNIQQAIQNMGNPNIVATA